MRTLLTCALMLPLGASLSVFAQNNATTSAAVCHGTGDPGCLGPFTGMAFNGLNYNLPANKADGSHYELSTVSVKPAGSALQAFVHLQPWFSANQGNVSYPLSCTSPGVTCTCPYRLGDRPMSVVVRARTRSGSPRPEAGCGTRRQLAGASKFKGPQKGNEERTLRRFPEQQF